jgi:hypothetical protein
LSFGIVTLIGLLLVAGRTSADTTPTSPWGAGAMRVHRHGVGE